MSLSRPSQALSIILPLSLSVCLDCPVYYSTSLPPFFTSSFIHSSPPPNVILHLLPHSSFTSSPIHPLPPPTSILHLLPHSSFTSAHLHPSPPPTFILHLLPHSSFTSSHLHSSTLPTIPHLYPDSSIISLRHLLPSSLSFSPTWRSTPLLLLFTIFSLLFFICALFFSFFPPVSPHPSISPSRHSSPPLLLLSFLSSHLFHKYCEVSACDRKVCRRIKSWTFHFLSCDCQMS